MKNIVIIGGGTAGWLTALAAQKRYPDCSIKVIESKEIGILGAGEGSTPNLIPFLNSLDISVEDLIKNTSSTMKLAIKFNKFSKENDFYYHGFAINKFNTKTKSITSKAIDNLPVLDLFYMSQNIDQSEYKITPMALQQNNVPFVKRKDKPTGLLDFDIYNLYSIHFDARALADYFSKIAIARGINHIDATVDSFISDNDGNISGIKLDDQAIINTDFVFDCTGFFRLINKKHFNTEWISFEKNLPAKKAIPFFLDIDKDNIPAYTESTAMNYGWMWKIPLQHRYGCGYVFDSNFISEEDAKLEIENMLGHEITSPKTFSFTPGYYKTIWNKNTIAVGLSAGFVEPLEATSIMQSVEILQIAFRKDFDIFNPRDLKEILNNKYKEDCEEICDFLYLHYMTNKNNTDFWINFTKNNIMPESLKKRISDLNELTYSKKESSPFDLISYYIIMNGNKLLSEEFKNKIINKYKPYKNEFELIKNKRKVSSNYFTKHSDFIKSLGGLNESI
jgi:tryptophan halogenase